LAPDPPSSTCQVNVVRICPGGCWWAAGRGGGNGAGAGVMGGLVSDLRPVVDHRGDAEGGEGRAGEDSGVGTGG
jgi:hypothetical protein